MPAIAFCHLHSILLTFPRFSLCLCHCNILWAIVLASVCRNASASLRLCHLHQLVSWRWARAVPGQTGSVSLSFVSFRPRCSRALQMALCPSVYDVLPRACLASVSQATKAASPAPEPPELSEGCKMKRILRNPFQQKNTTFE